MKFGNLSLLIECSTGSTPTVETVKRYISYVSRMGYTELYLGCTDAYKIEGEPYFNYKRGGFTTEDFQEMDRFAIAHGVELIANIQTLGHLDYLERHASYRDLMDTPSILMCGDERVYALVDKMFAAISKGLSSRRIHVGFDECRGLGTGNYLKKHGPADKKELLLNHLKKVVEIAKKYGYTCEIWHDMLIETDNTRITAEMVREALPPDTRVFYWDYFGCDPEALRKGIRNVKAHADKVGYAGSAFKCGSMAPLNTFSIFRMLRQMDASLEEGLDTYMVTLWSDNGAWVNNYSVLPSVYAVSEYNRGTWDGDPDHLDRNRFREITGGDFDEMMTLDLLDDPFEKKEVWSHSNYSFWMMLMDLFTGSWDTFVDNTVGEAFGALRKRYAATEGGAFSHLFRQAEGLAGVLEVKAALGAEIRRAYENKDREGLLHCLPKLDLLKERLEEYTRIYTDTWLRDNQSFGLEIDHLFLGGQIVRSGYYKKAILDYLETGKPIDELEKGTTHPDSPAGTGPDNYWESDWRKIISNVGLF